MSDVQDVTALLERITRGDKGALNRLFPLVYKELHERARRMAPARERTPTFTPTVLVHEAYMRLLGSEGLKCETRQHFYNTAAQAMQNVLIDKARHDKAIKNNRGKRPVDINGLDIANATRDELEALNEALEKLKADDPRRHAVVMQHIYAGCELKEIAQHMYLDEKTIQRDWKAAKLFLRAALADADAKE